MHGVLSTAQSARELCSRSFSRAVQFSNVARVNCANVKTASVFLLIFWETVPRIPTGVFTYLISLRISLLRTLNRANVKTASVFLWIFETVPRIPTGVVNLNSYSSSFFATNAWRMVIWSEFYSCTINKKHGKLGLGTSFGICSRNRSSRCGKFFWNMIVILLRRILLLNAALQKFINPWHIDGMFFIRNRMLKSKISANCTRVAIFLTTSVFDRLFRDQGRNLKRFHRFYDYILTTRTVFSANCHKCQFIK